MNISEPDEFDVFLQGIEKQSVPDIDKEAYINMREAEAAEVLTQLGYLSLAEDNERTAVFYRRVDAYLDKAYIGTTVEERSGLVQATINMQHQREIGIIEAVKVAALANKVGMDFEGLTFAQACETKKVQIARLYIMYKLRNDHMFIKFANQFIPGDAVSVDDENMTGYVIDALDTVAHQNESLKDSHVIIHEAYLYSGVDPNDESDEGIKIRSSALLLITSGEVLSHLQNGTNASANRQEKLYMMARQRGLDADITKRIINFIDFTFPFPAAS